MTSLPFLVVHGALIWKVLLVALVALVMRRAWRRQDLGLSLMFLGVCSVGGYGLLVLLGRIVVPSHAPEASTHISPFGRIAIAAALPDARGDALDLIDDIGTRVAADGDGLALGLSIDRFEGRCGDARLRDQGRFAEALVAERECGATDEARETLLVLGDYAGAAAVGKLGDPSRMNALIATRQWAAAAALAREVAVTHDPERADGYSCMADMLAGFDGDQVAIGRLATATSTACRAIRAAANEGYARVPDSDDSLPLGFVTALDDVHAPGPTAWLMAFAAPTQDGYRALQLRDAQVHRLLIRGQFAQAGAAAQDDMRLAVQVALASGGELPERRLLAYASYEDAIALRHGELTNLHLDSLVLDRRRCSVAEPLRSAITGDGRPLAELLQRCTVFESRLAPWLLGVLPHVIEHRDELARVLRYRSWRWLTPRISIFDAVDAFAHERDVARLAGDNERAEQLQGRIDRHADLLGDKQRVVALAISQALRPNW